MQNIKSSILRGEMEWTKKCRLEAHNASTFIWLEFELEMNFSSIYFVFLFFLFFSVRRPISTKYIFCQSFFFIGGGFSTWCKFSVLAHCNEIEIGFIINYLAGNSNELAATTWLITTEKREIHLCSKNELFIYLALQQMYQ